MDHAEFVGHACENQAANSLTQGFHQSGLLRRRAEEKSPKKKLAKPRHHHSLGLNISVRDERESAAERARSAPRSALRWHGTLLLHPNPRLSLCSSDTNNRRCLERTPRPLLPTSISDAVEPLPISPPTKRPHASPSTTKKAQVAFLASVPGTGNRPKSQQRISDPALSQGGGSDHEEQR